MHKEFAKILAEAAITARAEIIKEVLGVNIKSTGMLACDIYRGNLKKRTVWQLKKTSRKKKTKIKVQK